MDPRRLSRDEDDDDDDDGSYGDHDYRQDLGGGEDDHNHNSCNNVQCSVWRWLDLVISALGCWVKGLGRNAPSQESSILFVDTMVPNLE